MTTNETTKFTDEAIFVKTGTSTFTCEFCAEDAYGFNPEEAYMVSSSRGLLECVKCGESNLISERN